VAEDVEHPPQPGSDPAAGVVIGDDQVVVADPGSRQLGREHVRCRKRMTTGRAVAVEIRQVVVEIEVDRPREVPGGVGGDAAAEPSEIPADVDDPEVWSPP